MSEADDLARDGFVLLPAAVAYDQIQVLLDVCRRSFQDDSLSVRARSSRGHVYAARNLIGDIPEVTTVWQNPRLLHLLEQQFAADCELPDGYRWHRFIRPQMISS